MKDGRNVVLGTLIVELVAWAGTASPHWKAGSGEARAVSVRYGHAMAYDSVRGRVVLFGGQDLRLGRVKDTWEYDSNAWQAGAPAPSALTPREDAAMAFDAARGRMVLFGGWDGTDRHDLWEYDGAAWIPGAVAPGSLSGRSGHAMAHDPARGRIVLFGGQQLLADIYFDDTWEVAGGTWTAVTAPGPAARAGHAMAYDAGRGRVVLFGGDRRGSAVDDTWTFDGASWQSGPPAPAGLTARYEHAMAWDARAGRVLLFGGLDENEAARSDTWLLDPARGWLPGPPAPVSLVPRDGHALVGDTAWGRLVLFGGTGGTAPAPRCGRRPGSWTRRPGGA